MVSPYIIRHSSQKADSEKKAKIQAKINSFSSTLSELEKSPVLNIGELAAKDYEGICLDCFKVTNFPVCTSFITKNGLVDKLSPFKPKAKSLIKDLGSKPSDDRKDLLEKLLNFGLVEANEILEFITKLGAPPTEEQTARKKN